MVSSIVKTLRLGIIDAAKFLRYNKIRGDKMKNNSKNNNSIKGIGSDKLDEVIRKVFKKYNETIKRLS